MFEDAKMILPMKIWDAPEGKEDKVKDLLKSGKYMGSTKKDGFWYQFEKTTEGNSYLFSKTKSATTGCLVEKSDRVPHIIDILKQLPSGTILIGEIYYPGWTSSDVTSIMGCKAEKAIARQKETPLHYFLHDIIYFNNNDLMDTSAEYRYSVLKKVCKDFNLLDNDYIELAECVTDNLEKFIQDNFDKGEEGTVLKNKDTTYQPGKRPAWSSLKFKTEKTVDVVICGLVDATKEYTGKELDTWQYWEIQRYDPTLSEWEPHKIINGNPYTIRGIDFRTVAVTKPYYHKWKTAFEIGYYDNGKLIKIGTVSSGITEAMMQDMTESPENYIGKVIEVQCMSVDSKRKTLRHPRFKMFRQDKNQEDCTAEDIFGLTD